VCSDYKTSDGYAYFGDEWKPIFELCVRYKSNNASHSMFLTRILLIEKRLSTVEDFDESLDYSLILDDLRLKVVHIIKQQKVLENVIERLMDDLLLEKGLLHLLK
jgi:hypothetical protein